MNVDDLNEFSLDVDPARFWHVDVSDDLIGTEPTDPLGLEAIVLPDVPGTVRPLDHPRWQGAFTEPDPAGITLETLERAMAEVTSARIEMWSALDDLERLAVRDGRHLIVAHRDGVVEDAWIDRSLTTDDPRMFLIDVRAAELPPFGRPVWSWDGASRSLVS